MKITDAEIVGRGRDKALGTLKDASPLFAPNYKFNRDLIHFASSTNVCVSVGVASE